MRNFMILTEALNFIEGNLGEPITRNEIAGHCYASLSSLEKLFRYALHHSLREYIERRRMTQAAGDIADGVSVTQTAMKYQYNSVEVFSRAFRRVWGVTPSEFNDRWRFTGIFPKIKYEYREGDQRYMTNKHLDMSEAYDYLRQRGGTIVLCFDGKHFSAFNEISRRAGDMALLEMAARIDRAATEDMLLLRTGGDEFALITGLDNEDDARRLSDKILADNGKPIVFEGKELPLSLWAGMMRIPASLKYDVLFDEMRRVIDEERKKSRG